MTGRGLRGRETARLILASVVAIDVLVALLFIATPNCMCPMYVEPPANLNWLIPAVGIALHLGGLAWMIRIYRADPERHDAWWRFLHG